MKQVKKEIQIEFLEDCLLIDKELLVLGDVHIGYGGYVSEKDALLSIQFKEILKKLNRIFDLLKKREVKIKKIMILGDLKHEFGSISDREWSETLGFLDYLDGKIVECGENIRKEDRIILIKGNHDNILGPIAKKRNVKLVDYDKYENICFMHGDKLHRNCFEKSEILILGHLHPAITLSDEYKKEKYKCFLHGKWKRKEVYILPSFSPISFGYELGSIEESERDKEFLIINYKLLEGFDVIIYNNEEGKEYNFGKLKRLIKES